MQVMLLISGDEVQMAAATPANAGMSPDYAAYNEALVKAGVLLGGERLRPTSTARRVRVRDGKAVVLDGPYTDTAEQLGGYYLLEVKSVDEALDWATKCPAAKNGTVEVRPIWPTRP
jgi:hypothetical protein